MGLSVEKVLTVCLVLRKMAAMPIYDKKTKLLLLNQDSFEAESWYTASGSPSSQAKGKVRKEHSGLSTLGLQRCRDSRSNKFFKMMVVGLPFYIKVKFAPSYICMEENVEKSFSQWIIKTNG